MAINGVIWLTADDYNRLRLLLADPSRSSNSMQAGLDTLEEVLELARVVPPAHVPANVVTMNSRVLYEDLSTREKDTVTVVYPADSDPASAKISVRSPMGAALLGEAEGNEIEVPLPRGQSRRIRIKNVLYQPEAQGDFTL